MVMKLITIRSQILSVLDRWIRQYPTHEGDKYKILKKLEALDLKIAKAKNLEKIIGNSSWACPQKCYECEQYFDEIMQIGQEPDYDSSTTWICKNCLQKALKLFEEKK